MFGVLEVCILIGLFNGLCSTCNCEYSNEWLAEIHVDSDDVISLTKRYGFEYINKVGDNLFILKHINSPRTSRRRAEGIRKSILKETKVKYVEQQKWNKRALKSVTVNDPQWSNMWYLNGKVKPDMGVMDSWSNGYTGKGVTIGIVDDGVEVGHPDIKPNVNSLLSYDFYDRNNDPSPGPGNQHGTECAGVAAAVSNNSICVTGVAFQSQIAGLRLLGPSGSTSTGEHDALLRSGIDIYSNSWGIGEKNQFGGPSSIVKNALKKGVQQGRKGLGSIYIWAAGNGGRDDNCNCDGFVNSIYTVAISSVSATLQPPGYAEPCAAIMASAFSGGGGSIKNICSTSLNNSCVTSFTGTSAATPMAAGIFALVLEANPRLSWRDLQHLIVNTSDMTDLKFSKSKINGAGHTVSDLFGFGLLNSDSLIVRAKKWEHVTEQHMCMSKKTTVKQKIFVKNPNRLVSSSIYADGCNGSRNEIQQLEHVEIDITYQYSLRGAVQFYLISPSGTTSQLLTRRSLDTKTNSQQAWTFMSVQFWDESPVGNWTVQMSLDMDYGETGELSEWSLRLFGRSTNNYATSSTSASLVPTSVTSDNGEDKEYIIVGSVVGVIVLGIALIPAAAYTYGKGCKNKVKDNDKNTEPDIKANVM